MKGFKLNDWILVDFDGKPYPEGYDNGARFRIIGIHRHEGYLLDEDGHLITSEGVQKSLHFDLWMVATHGSYAAAILHIKADELRGIDTRRLPPHLDKGKELTQ